MVTSPVTLRKAAEPFVVVVVVVVVVEVVVVVDEVLLWQPTWKAVIRHVTNIINCPMSIFSTVYLPGTGCRQHYTPRTSWPG